MYQVYSSCLLLKSSFTVWITDKGRFIEIEEIWDMRSKRCEKDIPGIFITQNLKDGDTILEHYHKEYKHHK